MEGNRETQQKVLKSTVGRPFEGKLKYIQEV